MSIPKYLPILIMIGSNMAYHICAKSAPASLNPFLMLVVIYLVGAVTTLAIFLTTNNEPIAQQLSLFNWVPFAMGVVVVGLEFGTVSLYRAGWDISLGSLIANIGLAVMLVLVGVLFYKESITLHQVIGIFFCLVGLVFINK